MEEETLSSCMYLGFLSIVIMIFHGIATEKKIQEVIYLLGRRVHIILILSVLVSSSLVKPTRHSDLHLETSIYVPSL